MATILTRPGKIAQWGNSAAVRIGLPLLERANLNLDDNVEVIAGDDEIIIRRQRPRVTMAELLEKFDLAKHRHDTVFDDQPLGSETS